MFEQYPLPRNATATAKGSCNATGAGEAAYSLLYNDYTMALLPHVYTLLLYGLRSFTACSCFTFMATLLLIIIKRGRRCISYVLSAAAVSC